MERKRARAAFGVGGSYAIVYAGRFIPIKGIPLLIRAADLAYQKAPNAKLLLAGFGKRAYMSYVKALSTRVNVPVHFVGPIPWNRMQQYYWAADCFVCPTQGYEAFGLVVVEALASGLPAIASRNGGIPEIITHNTNGLLIDDYNQPQAFADAIVTLARNRELAKRLGHGGRRTALSLFGWQRTSESLHRLYFGGGG